MKHIFTLLTIISTIGCLSNKNQNVTLTKENINKETKTEYIQELNGDLTPIDASTYWSKVPFDKDSLKVIFFNYTSENFDLSLPIFSNQLFWVEKNQNKIFDKFKTTFNFNKSLQISELYFHDKDLCVIYFKSNNEPIKETLTLNENKEFFKGYFFNLNRL